MNVRLACFRSLFALLIGMSTALAGCDSGPASRGVGDVPITSSHDEPAQDASTASPAAPGAHDFARPANAAPSDVAADPAKEPIPAEPPVALPDPTPEVSSEIARPIRLTEQALLPESLATFRQIAVEPHALTIELDAEDAVHIQAGRVLAGRSGGGYLRRVVDVTVNPNGTLRVHTVPAELTELIADGHFVLRAAAAPPRAFQIGLPSSLPCTLEATGEVVEITPAYDFTPELDLEVDIDFDEQTLQPVLRYARATVSGELTLSTTLASRGTLHGRCSADLLAALMPVTWTTNFALGLLPITVRHHLGPSLTVALDVLLEGGMSATASVTVNLSAGLEYACGRWHDIAWASDVSGDFEVEPTARGTLTASLTPALGYEIELLGLASASVGIRSDLVGRVSADLVACSWEASLDASVTAYAHAHVDLPIAGPLVDIDEERVLWSDNLASDAGTLPICS